MSLDTQYEIRCEELSKREHELTHEDYVCTGELQSLSTKLYEICVQYKYYNELLDMYTHELADFQSKLKWYNHFIYTYRIDITQRYIDETNNCLSVLKDNYVKLKDNIVTLISHITKINTELHFCQCEHRDIRRKVSYLADITYDDVPDFDCDAFYMKLINKHVINIDSV